MLLQPASLGLAILQLSRHPNLKMLLAMATTDHIESHIVCRTVRNNGVFAPHRQRIPRNVTPGNGKSFGSVCARRPFLRTDSGVCGCEQLILFQSGLPLSWASGAILRKDQDDRNYRVSHVLVPGTVPLSIVSEVLLFFPSPPKKNDEQRSDGTCHV